MNRKTYLACNFNCHVDTEEHIKIAASHVHCESGNISEMVQDGDVVTTDH